MIYWRQKVLLSLLQMAPNKAASKIQLIKWLFLLKEEEKVGRYGSFYDFLPYKYGPFSFTVYRDITQLEHLGWIKPHDNSFQYVGSKRDATEHKLLPSAAHSVARIVENYGRLPQNRLVEYVYEEYPWYASRSEMKKSMQRSNVPRAEAAIYSLGYEGLSIDAFLDILLRARMKSIVDSRNNPASRKYGFTKSAMEKKCQDFGIGYFHSPEVGIPSEVRSQCKNKQILWKFYIQKLLPTASAALKSIADLCRKSPTVLVCFEKAPEDCHRHILAKELSVQTGLPIIHYRNEEKIWVKE